MHRCSSCGGFGVTLPLRAGICGHCERTGTSTAAQPALGAASVGQKRGRPDAALSAEEIARILEAGADDAVPALDSSGVKRMLLTLERAVSKNMSLRAKHASEPIKFLDSEVELDRALKALHALAAAPEQYSVLCASETLRSTFPSLLAHDNVDISVDVIELLKELLDDDAVGASETARAAALSLLEAFDSADILNLAMDNLSRLGAARPASSADGDPQQDSNCVIACFELVEAVVALAPSPYAGRLCRATASGAPSPLLNSLLAHAASKVFDDAKSLASEVLATLVSADPDIVSRIGAGSFRGGSVDGIECLLESVAVYKRRAPLGADEAETVNNLFDVLCTCLLLPANRPRFIAAEGFELMTRIISEAGFARLGAIKTLSFAVASSSEAEAFVVAGGLKGLFPALMGLGLHSTRKLHGSDAVQLEDEYVLSTLAALLEHLPRAAKGAPPAAGAGLERVRLLAKFLESGSEKVDRLVVFRLDYARSVTEFAEKEEDAGDDDDDDSDDESEARSRRASFILSKIDSCLRILNREKTIESGDQATAALSQHVADAVAARCSQHGILDAQ